MSSRHVTRAALAGACVAVVAQATSLADRPAECFRTLPWACTTFQDSFLGVKSVTLIWPGAAG